MAQSDSTKTNSSTRHVIEAMRLIAQSPHPLGLNEIAESMVLPQSTAHRALMTLEESGFAKRSGRTAKLIAGETIHHLIRSMVGLFPARAILADPMRALCESCDVTVSLNWRIGWHSMRLSAFEGTRESYQIRRIGEARPLHLGIGPRTILAALGPAGIEAYQAWWAQSGPRGDEPAPDMKDLAALARTVSQDGKLRLEPTDYSALNWLSYPLRSGTGAVLGSLSVGVVPDRLQDTALAAGIDEEAAAICATLVAAGDKAATPFDDIPPDEIQMEELKVIRLTAGGS
ncbi:helix-turn-helix domain-containing protein [Mameliella alba]|nr:helix-turn-helix domain-containing protein [Mameliella alba]MBY6171781.1 helix-turn-helix domain-containing protein [Mameliella alba]MBY6177006.1 helix-turn-helix domain-containing protein [Mameliella alba]